MGWPGLVGRSTVNICVRYMGEGFVYTLALEDGCYYCGWSADPSCRIAQHFLGRGAHWTRVHQPVRVLLVLQAHYHSVGGSVYVAQVRGGPGCP